jgi:RNase P subunit RPR2
MVQFNPEGLSEITPGGKCDECRGNLVKVESLPISFGFEMHKFVCDKCGTIARIKIDTRFI